MAVDNSPSTRTIVIHTLVAFGLLGCAQLTTGIIRDIDNATLTPPAIKEPLTQATTVEPVEMATHTATPTRVIRPSKTPSPIPSPTLAPMETTGFDLVQEAERLATHTVTPTSTLSTSVTSPLSTTATVTVTVIGNSYENRPIIAYQFGDGSEPVVLVGGMHGGYEWDSILLAYEAIDYFTENPQAVPDSVSLYIVPSANPDGQYAVTDKEGRFTVEDLAENTIPGRFNGRGVDLNRNWDCQWADSAIWRDQPVNPGAGPFSEPESLALRDFLVPLQPIAVIFYHSAAEGVYAAGCPENYLPSRVLADIYGQAAGYPVFDRFDHYDITGDAGDWLATQGIPSITVELVTHEDLQWAMNLAGLLMVVSLAQEDTLE